MPGDAQTLRDYWSGHGHAGPSHGAERDAIAWGTPGDFNRCVAQVTEHGKMTPEQAKGYCNLRHHDALGYYPGTHARMERGKMDGPAVYELFKAREAYRRGPDETVQCPACHKYDAPDARFCDQCGTELPSAAFKDRHNLRENPGGRFRPRGEDADELAAAVREGRVKDAAALVTAHETRVTVPEIVKYLSDVVQ
jgi:hypothetical protein